MHKPAGRSRQTQTLTYHYGTFQRNISLPTQVNSDKAQATFQNGILKLTLPKVEEAKPKHIPLKAR
jgi:HSP20 family protein